MPKTAERENVTRAGHTFADLPAEYQKQVSSHKRQVVAAAEKFGAFREAMDRGKLALTIMRIFDKIRGLDEFARPNVFTLADFARCFDPSVPTARGKSLAEGGGGYVNHKMYQALDYMQRKLRQPRGRTTVDKSVGLLARTIKTVLQLIPTQPEVEALWIQIAEEFKLTKRTVNPLKDAVEKAEPIFNITAPRAGNIRIGNVIHMKAPAETAATLAEAAQAVGAKTKPRGLARAGARLRKAG